MGEITAEVYRAIFGVFPLLVAAILTFGVSVVVPNRVKLSTKLSVLAADVIVLFLLFPTFLFMLMFVMVGPVFYLPLLYLPFGITKLIEKNYGYSSKQILFILGLRTLSLTFVLLFSFADGFPTSAITAMIIGVILVTGIIIGFYGLMAREVVSKSRVAHIALIDWFINALGIGTLVVSFADPSDGLLALFLFVLCAIPAGLTVIPVTGIYLGIFKKLDKPLYKWAGIRLAIGVVGLITLFILSFQI